MQRLPGGLQHGQRIHLFPNATKTKPRRPHAPSHLGRRAPHVVVQIDPVSDSSHPTACRIDSTHRNAKDAHSQDKEECLLLCTNAPTDHMCNCWATPATLVKVGCCAFLYTQRGTRHVGVVCRCSSPIPSGHYRFVVIEGRGQWDLACMNGPQNGWVRSRPTQAAGYLTACSSTFFNDRTCRNDSETLNFEKYASRRGQCRSGLDPA